MTAWQDMTIWERFIDEHSRLKLLRNDFDASRKVIAEQFRPDIVGKHGRGQFTGQDIIEGTGPWALGVMTRGLLGSLAGPSFTWIQYAVMERVFKGNDRINKWLQEIREHMEPVYRHSTFYDIMPGYVAEGLSIGSPVTIIEEDIVSSRSVFHRPHYAKCWFDRDVFGDVNVLEVEHEYSHLVASKRFGRENLSTTTQNELKEGNHTKTAKYLQLFYPVDHPIFDGLKEPVNIPQDAKCVMFYIEEDASETEKQKPLSQDPYYSKPYVVWDYIRNADEICARTPAWDAMADVKTHNAQWKTTLKSGQRRGDPAIVALDTMRGKLRLGPGARNYVTTQEYDRPPKPAFDAPHSFTETEYLLNTSAQSLRRHFHVSVFMKIEEYQRQHKQPPSATEILAMEGENAPQIGPAVQSVERGLLSPIDMRLMGIEGEAGRLPPPPDEWLEFTEKGEVNPVFVGPIAVAQKSAMSIRDLDVFFAIAEKFVTLDVMLVHKMDLPVAMEDALEKANIPQGWLKSQEAYEAITQKIAEQQAQQELIEQAGAVAEGAGKIMGPTDPTSPLAAIAGAA